MATVAGHTESYAEDEQLYAEQTQRPDDPDLPG